MKKKKKIDHRQNILLEIALLPKIKINNSLEKYYNSKYQIHKVKNRQMHILEILSQLNNLK